MLTLTMTKGLPASGKSTWAKEQVANSNGKIKRVNKDDLRDMIDAGKWSSPNEKMILKVRDDLISKFLANGYSVIVDDTNLHPKHERALLEIAENNQVNFKVQSFLDVPLLECIRRDLSRHKSVGERVIEGMFNQYLKPSIAEVEPNPDLPNAIICDIDGTLAHMKGRSPYDWKRVGEDEVDITVRGILSQFAEYDEFMPSTYIILMSGRSGVCRPETEKWLLENNVHYHELHMRSEEDTRKDTFIKKELFDTYVRERYNVRFVLDDRNSVVEMWRDMGLKVLQVQDGDF